MASYKRPGAPARIGGKVALFEVIQQAQAGIQADGEVDPAMAPLVRGEAPTTPATFAAPTRHQLRPAGVSAERAADPTRGDGGSRPLLIGLSAFAAVAVLGAVFFVGRLTGDAPAKATAASPPDPSVLNVPADAGAAALPPAFASAAVQSSAVPLAGTADVAPPAASPGVRRTFGLNYVLIESYHPSERDRALATRDALLKNGINATIEDDVPGWGKRLCIVGTLGFEHIRGNDKLRAYMDQINKVSDVVSKDRKIKTFDPVPFLWGGK